MIFLQDGSIRITDVRMGVGPTRRDTNTIVVELLAEDVLKLIADLSKEVVDRDIESARVFMVIEKDQILPQEIFE